MKDWIVLQAPRRRLTSAALPASTLLLWGTVALGVLLRVRSYAFGRAMWSDEAALANNFVQRSLASLVTRPLDHEQAAPLGFIVAVKTLALWFGTSDYALRLLPFAAAALVPVCAYPLACRIFKSTVARWTFLALVSCSPVLIYYASEFKQYSVDVLVAVVLLWIAIAYRDWRGGFWILVGAGAVAIWLSHPAVFVLAGIGAALALSEWRSPGREGWSKLALAGLVWAVSLGLDYRLALQSMARDSYLTDYWRAGYAPLPGRSAQDAQWYLSTPLGLVFMAFEQAVPLGPEARLEWFQAPNIALCVLVLAGAAASAFRVRKAALIAAIVVLANLAASAVHVYPFRNRLILYLLPFVYLVTAAVFEVLSTLPQRRMRAPLALLAVLPVAFVAVTAAGITLAPADYSDMKSALRFVQDHKRLGDYLSINDWSGHAFDFYNRFYDLAGVRLIDHTSPSNDPDDYLKTLCAKGTVGRTWVVMTHDPGGQYRLLKGLRQAGPVLTSWEADKAAAYLFDFSGLPGCASTTNSSRTETPTLSLAADRETVSAGGCATLRWDVEHVKEVYLDEEGVTGHGERKVCPPVTTSYWLRAVTDDQDIYRVATLWVSDSLAGQNNGADRRR